MTNEDLAAKIGWEGGVTATLDYGLRSEDIVDPELRALWAEAETRYEELSKVTDKIEEKLEAYLN
jgi:hypothetical protein